MAGERLLIVEDERIVAEDLRDMLERLEYKIVGMATSGEEAIRKAEQLHPDLVLMDIRLNGALDGIQAAETIGTHYNIPVTYLTAYADEATLERAKATMPFGYILKPFEERDLRTTVEIALYKHRMDATLTKMEGWYASALESLTEAVIAINPQGGITFMNPAAENLTGSPLRQVYGKKFTAAFNLTSDDGDKALGRALEGEPPAVSTTVLRPTAVLKTRDGREVPIEYGVNPIKDDQGTPLGNLVMLRKSAPQKKSKTAV